ncbi:hypothetical protein DERF_014235 [Dermatophagoides farinae]|uniref:Uncharacterized protein n=1 Tax=Dermatophagoides farinae TaxID=6954 RepID=A0A922HHJ2_DERFA|nr:hypothetical protein DERF_014235 [Dermatophagoides farinae]
MCTWLVQYCYIHCHTTPMTTKTWPSTTGTGLARRIFWPDFDLPTDISSVCLHARPPDEHRESITDQRIQTVGNDTGQTTFARTGKIRLQCTGTCILSGTNISMVGPHVREYRIKMRIAFNHFEFGKNSRLDHLFS